MEPALLLLDEPLSNLDAKLRERMRFELKRMQRELKITTVYVTHDQSEALALSHQIAVMSDGRILQIGSPRDIYERPRNKFVADFVGTTNFLEATITGWSQIGSVGNMVPEPTWLQQILLRAPTRVSAPRWIVMVCSVVTF